MLLRRGECVTEERSVLLRRGECVTEETVVLRRGQCVTEERTVHMYVTEERQVCY